MKITLRSRHPSISQAIRALVSSRFFALLRNCPIMMTKYRFLENAKTVIFLSYYLYLCMTYLTNSEEYS